MVDPEITPVYPNRQKIFYKCSTQPHTGDDKIKVLLLLCTAKLQIMREMMPPAVIYSNLHTAIADIIYWQYNWNTWPQTSIPWLRIFLTWPVYLICITTTVRRNCRLTTCSWKVTISLLKNGWLLGSRNTGQRPICQIAHILLKDTLRGPNSKNHI